MDYIIYYIEIGLIANAVMLVLDVIIALYLVFSIGLMEAQKYALIVEGNSDRNMMWSILHYFIPFFAVYLFIIQLVLINKYFDKTAESLDFIIKELDKYKIFRRFR